MPDHLKLTIGTIPPTIRQQLMDLPLQPWRLLKIPFLFLLWAILGYWALHTSLPAIRLFAWVLIGAALNALGHFMHDGLHNSLTRSRWQNRLIGTVCSLPVFNSIVNFSVTHYPHHTFLNQKKDLYCLHKQIAHPKWLTAAIFMWNLVGTFFFTLWSTCLAWLLAKNKEKKLACMVDSLLYISVFILTFYLLYSYHLIEQAVIVWIIPWIFSQFISNIRAAVEHYILPWQLADYPLGVTRTITSNKVVGFFLNNQNYHVEHHLFARLPWYHLPTAHQLLKPYYNKQCVKIENTYVKLFFKALWLSCKRLFQRIVNPFFAK